MNNKVKFLRGTSNEYAVAEKDNDTIYFTTDDGKLYIGDKEISGGKGGGSYELPIATTEILGGVMPDGTTINVDENGVISGLTAGAKLLVSGTGKLFTYTGSYEVFFVYVGAVSYTDSNQAIHKYTIDKRGFILNHNSSTRYIELYDDSGSNSITVRIMDDNRIFLSYSATVCVYGV